MHTSWLTTRELASLLNVSIKRIRRAYRNGEIPVQLFFLLSHCCTWIHLITSGYI